MFSEALIEQLMYALIQVHTVEEQVRAAAEYKLGVANQSITAGFFDDNTRYVKPLMITLARELPCLCFGRHFTLRI